MQHAVAYHHFLLLHTCFFTPNTAYSFSTNAYSSEYLLLSQAYVVIFTKKIKKNHLLVIFLQMMVKS